jgi:hypothetical protein
VLNTALVTPEGLNQERALWPPKKLRRWTRREHRPSTATAACTSAAPQAKKWWGYPREKYRISPNMGVGYLLLSELSCAARASVIPRSQPLLVYGADAHRSAVLRSGVRSSSCGCREAARYRSRDEEAEGTTTPRCVFSDDDNTAGTTTHRRTPNDNQARGQAGVHGGLRMRSQHLCVWISSESLARIS